MTLTCKFIFNYFDISHTGLVYGKTYEVTIERLLHKKEDDRDLVVRIRGNSAYYSSYENFLDCFEF